MTLDKEQADELLRQMHQIRAFEEQAEKSYMMDRIHGTMRVTLAVDHQVIDGTVAAASLAELKAKVKSPALLLW